MHSIFQLNNIFKFFQIPVFPGCERALISPTLTAPLYHGEDGFGDVPDKEAPGLDMAQSEHAVLGLIRLIQENPGNTLEKIKF